jgi:serine/threonine protein kinase
VARFTREARTTALLNHPNIVAVHDVGSHLGVPFVVSELLDGKTLRQHMQEGPLAVRTAIGYALDVAHGLFAAHRLGVVHRDLKPENIFVTSDGRVKILDFGLAKCCEAPHLDESSTATTSGIIVGTVGYASPEQLRGGAVDARADLFSVGVVLYEMLAGVAPYRRESAIETLHAILKEQPVPLRRCTRHIPADLDAIVTRCLEKSPDQRFQSAHDLAFSLELALGREQAAARRSLSWRIAALFGLV